MTDMDQDEDEGRVPAGGAPYTVFRVHGSLYAVDARATHRILWIPELTPIEEAPPYLAGVFNLRGTVVPVVNLDRRFGHPPESCRITDCVIVLETGAGQTGLLVNHVLDVVELRPLPITDARMEVPGHLLTGEAQLGNEIVMLIDPEQLLPEAVVVSTELVAHQEFCPDMVDADRSILRKRAQAYVNDADGDEITGPLGMAVVGLGNELFGVDLTVVREFSDIGDVAPVPCCPAHVVGNMNLRGDIVTLMDIRAALDMPISVGHDAQKLLVAEHDSLLLGVPVDDIYDVLFVAPSEFKPAPAAVAAASAEYIKGEVPYETKMITVLDLQRILDKGDLAVDEQV